MRVLQLRRQPGGASGSRAGVLKPVAAFVLASAMVLSMSSVARADDGVDLTPGPHVVADPNSPTGYTGHFVYYNPTATSVRFVGDILLRNWADPTDTTVYQPQQYRPGLMRGGGGYDVQMTERRRRLLGTPTCPWPRARTSTGSTWTTTRACGWRTRRTRRSTPLTV